MKTKPMNLADQQKPSTKTMLFLYHGRIELKHRKLGWELTKLNDKKERVGDSCVWTFKKQPPLRAPGSIYRVDVPADSEGDTVHGSTFRFVEPWPNEAERQEMAAKSDTAETVVEAKRLARKKEDRTNAIREACAPLRAMYSALGPFQRDAFLVIVMNEVRRGGLINVSTADEE